MKKTELKNYSSIELEHELKSRAIYDPMMNEFYDDLNTILQNFKIGLVDSHDTYQSINDYVKLINKKINEIK